MARFVPSTVSIVSAALMRTTVHPSPCLHAISDTGFREKLQEMKTNGQLPDVLTFAGNGEPTCHPHFAEIIDDTILLRDKYCPKAKVCVLSNSTMIHRHEVHDALMKVDDNILKLDTVDPSYINKVDHPNGTYDVNKIIERMKAFHGHLIIQTMFMRGACNGESVDNTSEEYVSPGWRW